MNNTSGRKMTILGGFMVVIGLIGAYIYQRTGIPTTFFQLLIAIAIIGAILCAVGVLMDIRDALEERTETPQNAPSEAEPKDDE
jgi:uncharacterized membrane protein